MLPVRRIVPSVVRYGIRPVSSAPVALSGSKDGKSHDEFDDDVFELLPPGASMKDPLYGLNPDDRVHIHDKARSLDHSDEEIAPPPRFVATHSSAKESKKELVEEDDDDHYVYLPPGSSMREPGDSLSEPTDKKVYYRDPNPAE